MAMIQDKTVLYLTDLPLGFIIADIEMFLSNYKEKIMFISVDQNKKMMEKRKIPAVKVVFRDYESANSCRIEMNLRKIKGKSVRIMWDERDTSIRYNTTSNIFVKGIPKSISPREVYEYFYKFGDISSAKINEDDNGNHFGYGYITYYSPENARKAIEESNGKKIWDTVVEVEHFQKKNERGFNEIEVNNQKIFINNIPDNYSPTELKEFCKEYGEIKSCDIFTDNNIGKKFGIVQFSSEKEAKDVLLKLDGKELNGKKLIVKMFQNTYEHKQYIQNNSAKLNEKCQGCNLIIKNIPLNATEDDLMKAFEKFGRIISVKIEKERSTVDPKNKNKIDVVSKGFGYLLFDNEKSAKEALESMNWKYLPGFEIWKKPLDIEIFRTRRERQAMGDPAPPVNISALQNMPKGFPGMIRPYTTYFPGQPIPAPMNVPFHYRNLYMDRPIPFSGMMRPYSGYNNYRQPHNNSRFPQRGRGGNRGHYRNQGNNYYHNNRAHEEKNEPQKVNSSNIPSSNPIKKFDIEAFEKITDEQERKEFLGEKLFQSISESPIIINNKIDEITIGKITGMIIELPDTKEIIDILENDYSLNARIEEALGLLKASG